MDRNVIPDEVKEAVGKELEGPSKLLKATSNDKEFQGTWVIKKYLPKSIIDVQATGQSIRTTHQESCKLEELQAILQA